MLFAGDTLFSLGCGRVMETPLARMWDSLVKLVAAAGRDADLLRPRIYAVQRQVRAHGRPRQRAAEGARRARSRRCGPRASRPCPPRWRSNSPPTRSCAPTSPTSRPRVGLPGADPAAVFAELRERKNRSDADAPRRRLAAFRRARSSASRPRAASRGRPLPRDVPRPAARMPAGRALSTAIFFLLAGDEVSAWHRVDAAEIWHYYAGAPLVLTPSPDGHDAAAAPPRARRSPPASARRSSCRPAIGRPPPASAPGPWSAARSRRASPSRASRWRRRTGGRCRAAGRGPVPRALGRRHRSRGLTQKRRGSARRRMSSGQLRPIVLGVEHPHEVVGARHRPAVERHDHVAGQQARLVGRAASAPPP